MAVFCKGNTTMGSDWSYKMYFWMKHAPDAGILGPSVDLLEYVGILDLGLILGFNLHLELMMVFCAIILHNEMNIRMNHAPGVGLIA